MTIVILDPNGQLASGSCLVMITEFPTDSRRFKRIMGLPIYSNLRKIRGFYIRTCLKIQAVAEIGILQLLNHEGQYENI